ncbi:transglycosylase SLT domain-containing protein [Desemzia sp. FAM 23990]|uniref:transglycosylase SLT domain-containing protein n=1 Tax=Desemzia sp. FAM 23990 TaxID=3259520 RepID=UPI0038838EAA
MSDSLRKSVITIDWKINNDSLVKANKETDDLISRVGQNAEQAFGKTEASIDKSAASLKKHNVVIVDTSKSTDNARKSADSAKDSFVDLGKKSADSLDKTDDEAQDLNQSMEKVGKKTDSAKTDFIQLGNSSQNSLNKASRASKDVSNSVGDIGNKTDSAKGKVSGFASSFKTSMKKAESATSGVISKVDTLSTRVASAAKTLAATLGKTALVAGALAVAGTGYSFNAASDLNESFSKTEVAFDSQSDVIKDWSKNTIENYGLAQGTALDLAATFGDMSTSMGLSDKEAAKMSMSMVGLAGDLSSFKNIDIENTYAALNGVFTGETESLKTLGIIMTQTNLEQFALNKGMEKSVKEMSQAELVQLRYAYVMEMTKNAQGDFARTSDQAANSTRVFWETTKEFAANAGQSLLPLFTPVIQFGSKMISRLNGALPAWEKALAPYSEKVGEGLKWIEERIDDVPEALKKASAKFEPVIKPALEALETAKDFMIDTFIPTIGELASSMGPGFMEAGIWAFETIGTVIEEYAKPAFEWLEDYSAKNPGQMKMIAKGASIAVGGLLLFNTVKKPVSAVISIIDGIVGAIDKIAPSTENANKWLSKLKIPGAKTAPIAPTGAAPVATTATGGSFIKGVGSKVAGFGSKLLTGAKNTGGWLTGATQGAKATQGAQMFFGGATKGAKLLNGAKNVGVLGKTAAKSVPGLSLLLAGSNLIGMNQDNAGEKVGETSGMIAGGGMGAALGSIIAPGIGTIIGGAIGTFAGSALGKNMGEYVQEHWKDWGDKLSDFGEKHPITGMPIRFVENSVEAAKDGIDFMKNLFKDPFADTTEVDLVKDGVSKESAKKVTEWMEGQNELDTARVQKQFTGGAISQKELDAVLSARDQQNQTIVDALNGKKEASGKNVNILQDAGVLGSDDVASILERADHLNKKRVDKANELSNELKALEQKKYDEQLAITKKYEEQISGIKQKAKEDGRTLTQEELAEINRLEEQAGLERKGIYEKYEPQITQIQEDQKKGAVQALSASAEEQAIILGRLNDNTEQLSAKQAADIVKNSVEARDGAISAANDKYDKVIAAAEEEYYVHGTISKAQFEEIKANAESQRDSSITAAEEMHEGVVDQAKQQAKGHLKQVDWQTGESLSMWDRFVASIAKVWNAITGGINNVMKALGLDWHIDEWKPSGYNNNTRTKSNAKPQSTATQMYYSGTSAAYGGPALVGEEGFELAYDKAASQAMILGANGPEVTQIKSGTQILNHRDSVKLMSGGLGAGSVLPGFDRGNTSLGGMVSSGMAKVKSVASNLWGNTKEFASNAWDGAKNIGGKVADIASGAWDWVSDPAGKLKELVAKHNPFSLGSNNTMELTGAGFIKTAADGAKDWVTEKVAGLFNFSGTGSTEQVNSWISKAISIAGVPASWAGPLSTIAMKESGGNPTAQNNWDINAKNGIPSKGLMQTIGPTFNAYKASGHGNIMNPIDNVLASINYIKSRYGDVFNVPGIKSMSRGGAYVGYAKGGKASKGETFLAGENGPELITAQDPTTILPNGLTSKLIGQQQSEAKTFEFKPEININIEGSGDPQEVANKVKKEVAEQMELMYEKMRRLFDPEVAY